MTKAKAKAKPKQPRPPVAKKPARQYGVWALAAYAAIVSGVCGSMLWDKPTPLQTNEFTTFERRIRDEVWGEGAIKSRHGEFKDARAALDWMKKRWPEVEGEVFLPNDKEEAIAGQDLDSLAALWERWSK